LNAVEKMILRRFFNISKNFPRLNSRNYLLFNNINASNIQIGHRSFLVFLSLSFAFSPNAKFTQKVKTEHIDQLKTDKPDETGKNQLQQISYSQIQLKID